MSNANPPAARPRASAMWGAAGFVALALYGIFLARHFSPVAGGGDSSGYLNSARLLAAGRLAAELRVPAEFGPPTGLFPQWFQPQGFVPREGMPQLAPTYAVGLPLHLAAAGKIFGWSAAPTVVGVLGALATLALMHAAGRELGLEPALAAAGAAVLAAFPVFFFMSIQPLSDTLATAWCLTAVLAALRSRRNGKWALAAGAAVGVAVLVRVTNILLLPALLVLLGPGWRRAALAIAGGLPAALWLGFYHHALYGSPWRTGYVNVGEAFAWRHGAPTAVHFAMWFALMLPAVLLALPVAAWARRIRAARLGWGLGLWFAAFVIFYAFYEITREVWWGLRFVLPATPALIFAGLLGAEAWLKTNRARAAAAAGLALWAAGLGSHWINRHHLLLTKTYEQAYADAAEAARTLFPPGTLVVAGLQSGALLYYTDFPMLRWEFFKPAEFDRFRDLALRAGRPIGAVLFDSEEKEALRERCRGEWRQVAKLNNMALWRYDAPPP